jgi:DNA-binding response OmpR family regulator
MSHANRILIVDDEPNVRLVFRTALASADYEMATAEDGAAALTALEESNYDLVLLDLHMPILDGMEVLRRMREAGVDVPVVIITAHGSVPNAVETMKLGAIDFLTKPISPDCLRLTVAEVLLRHARVESGRTASVPRTAPVTAGSQYSEDLARAKRALNNRWFEEAEVYLKQAIALKPDSAEAHNLLGVLHELRNDHDASYREFRAALKADRHHEPAKHNMRRYYERFTFGRSAEPIDTGDRE